MTSSPAASRPAGPGSAAEPAPSSPGLGVVAGRYRVLGRIAEGGMGVVYKAEHTLSKKKLALKILHPHLCHGRQAVERFKREVSAAAEIDHPGIVQVFDAGVDTDGSFYMAMELLEGESLGQRTRRDWPGTRTAVALIAEMCEPLARAHAKGFVHRDLKPDNVFIARDPETGRERVKLLDFGLAREVTQRRGPTMSGITFGTPEYMSPEQCMSAKKAGVPSDVWSVGVMLYELLAGRHPFTGETPNAVMANAIKEPLPPLADVAPHVPADLAAIVERCLEKEPTRRPADAGELGELLRDLAQTVALDDRCPESPQIRRDEDEPDGDASAEIDAMRSVAEPLAPPRDVTTSYVPRERRSRPWLAWGLVGAGVVAVGAVLVSVWASRGSGAMVATELPSESAPVAGAPSAGGAPVAEAPSAAPSISEPVAEPPSEGEAERVEPAPPEPVAVRAPVETPAEAPRAEPSSRASRARGGEPRADEAEAESALDAAHACLARGDTRCAVAALQDARGASAMALLVDVYRMQGRAGDARGVMQRYVQRYPRGAQTAAYQRELGLAGQ